MINLTKYLVPIAFGAVVGILIMRLFFWPDITERTEITYDTETKIDWVEKDTLIINYKDSLIIREETKYREVSPEPEKYDSIRIYSGFEAHQYGRINWEVKTGGYLHELQLNPVLKIPVETITNTVEKTTTRTIKSKGLYGTGGVNSEFKYSAGITYINDKSLFGYEYSPQLNLHEIKAGFKLF